jgi:hypothetical protein
MKTKHLLLGLGAWGAMSSQGAEPAQPSGGVGLFDRAEALSLDLYMDTKALCRDPRRDRCDDLPAELVYRDDDGAERRVEVSLRSRGRFRDETGDCSLPALFVFFHGDTAGTLFENQDMLPLTTHCRTPLQYERYVLKEHLAYRIYNVLTDKSLRTRLARTTYHDTSGRTEPLTRYAFFVEHFDALAERHDAVAWKPERFDVLAADPVEIATLDVFQYMVGNTDWSVIFGHNVVLIQDAAGRATAVPYDFDFSGLVDAEYASVAPELPIRDVKQRLFRGICRPDTDWARVFATFEERRGAIERLTRLSELPNTVRDDARRYLGEFFETLSSEARRVRDIVSACRSPR